MDCRPPVRSSTVTADVAYDGRPNGLVFVVGDKRLQHVYVRNGSARHRVMAKIQSTSSRKFRVRPGFAVLGPHESVAVQIQLSPSERDASECKFLLVVRCVDAEDDGALDEEAATALARRGSTATREQTQQQRDADAQRLWQRAEARQHDSLVVAETIVARILAAPADHDATRVHVPPPVPPQAAMPDERPSTALHLRIDSLEARAETVALLMQSQSRLPQNQLRADQLDALRRLRERCAAAWPALEHDARRMRVLARQFAQRRPAS